uniref:Uncharacterized protein n=1 Tax=Cacopsylla melanoneura TaxID=428564 RepID=A0A8D8TWP0_9HEMI
MCSHKLHGTAYGRCLLSSQCVAIRYSVQLMVGACLVHKSKENKLPWKASVEAGTGAKTGVNTRLVGEDYRPPLALSPSYPLHNILSKIKGCIPSNIACTLFVTLLILLFSFFFTAVHFVTYYILSPT